MKTNMGKADRIIRFLITAIIVILYTSDIISGTLMIVLLGLAGVCMLTSFAGYCPLYNWLGFNSGAMEQDSDS